MNILITGSSGQLGNALSFLLNKGCCPLGKIDGAYDGASVCAVDVDRLDITDADAVNAFVANLKPDLIINCAAFTNVDACEEKKDLAYAVNAIGPKNLAAAAASVDAKFVHVSTDYVFSGEDSEPRVETDKTAPQSVYGSTKLAGEQFVLAECKKSFIFRTAWLYGKIGKNFVKTIINKARTDGVLTVVDDQRGNPTNADDLAFHILKVAVTDNYGIYHCTNNGECSWYEFACKIVEYAGIPCKITPCTSEQFVRAAKRPAYSSLCNLALKNTVGDSMRDWKVALKDYINTLEE